MNIRSEVFKEFIRVKDTNITGTIEDLRKDVLLLEQVHLKNTLNLLHQLMKMELRH